MNKKEFIDTLETVASKMSIKVELADIVKCLKLYEEGNYDTAITFIRELNDPK